MKTIIVPTDLSKDAENAASYALSLAKVMRVELNLCYAFTIPTNLAMMPIVTWPLGDPESILQETTKLLSLLAKKLTIRDHYLIEEGPYHPPISYQSRQGSLLSVINNQIKTHNLNLVILGLHGAGAASRFFMGSNSRNVIDKAHYPVILVPSNVTYKPIHKIAFATDLSATDLCIIHSLASFARHFDAEILLVNIGEPQIDRKQHGEKVNGFLNEVTCKIDYSKIYYRYLDDMEVDKGIEWITQHGEIDMMVMVHRKSNWLVHLLAGSHSQEIATRIKIPLMVLQENTYSVF